MSRENKETLEVYNRVAQRYLDNTINHNKVQPEKTREKQEKLALRIREAFKTLPAGAKILEIGSADGENAKTIESFGYNVIASDVAPAFLEACKKQGLQTIKFNVLEDEFPADISGVFCWRVFVHFTREDILVALRRIYEALKPMGRLVFSVFSRENHDSDFEMKDFSGEYKLGALRYFAYYRRDEILKIIKETNFKIVDEWLENASHEDLFCFVLEKENGKS